jgi:hypothetical protein
MLFVDTKTFIMERQSLYEYMKDFLQNIQLQDVHILYTSSVISTPSARNWNQKPNLTG